MAVSERVEIDVLVRDFGTGVIQGFNAEVGRMGAEGERAGRRAAAGIGEIDTASDKARQGVDKATQGMGGGISGVLDKAKGLAGFLAGGFALSKIADFAKDSIGMASDLNETGTKLQAVFGDGTAAVEAFAARGPKALGQTSLAIKDAASQFGVFGKAAGLTGDANAQFSTNLAGLSTDLASFYNTTPQQAAEALAAGLRGETEPLRQYGVLLDDATLRQKAMALGLTTTTKDALTPQQKVLAANAVILEQTTLAQGDFARTSGGLANQQRILSAQWGEMKGKLGEVFLPVVTSIVTAINDRLMPVLAGFVDNLPHLIDQVKEAWGVLTSGDFTAAGSTLGASDSPIVKALTWAHDKFIEVRDTLKEAWSTLVHGDLSGVQGAGEGTMSTLASGLNSVRDMLPSFTSLITIAGGVLKYLADHIDTIVALLPALAAGFAAYKLAQAAANVAALAAVPLQAAQIASNFALAAANRALAISLGYTHVGLLSRIGSMIASTATTIAHTVATVATTIASWAQTAATAAWTAAQWLLNAALNANPIAIVLIALAAFAAAVVWAYNNVGWFRDIVDAAWSFIRDFMVSVWENQIKPALEQFWQGIQKVGDFFSWLWNSIIVPVWQNAIAPAIQFVWENIIKPYFEAWWAAIQAIGTVVQWLWDSIIVPVWQNLIGPAISAVWENVIKPAWEGLKGFIAGIGDFFNGIKSGVETAVTWVTQKITDIKDAITGFFDEIDKKAADATAASVASGTATASSAGNILSGGIPGVVYGGSAAGGLITGGGGPRDDRVIRRLSPGEYVVNAAATARNLGALIAINSDTGLAGGGVVGFLPGDWSAAVAGAQTAVGNALGGQSAKGLSSAQNTALAAQAAQQAAAPGGALYTGPVSGGVEQWRSLALQALAMTGQAANNVTALLHQMETESSGNPNAINLTDINAQRGDPSIGLMQVIGATFRAYAMPGYSSNIRDPLSNILASIRYALARYGSLAAAYRGVAYDFGGMWASGTAGFNTSGRVEAVLTGAEKDAYQAHARNLAAGFGGRTVTVAAGAVQINVSGSLNNAGQVRAELERALREILADDRSRSY